MLLLHPRPIPRENKVIDLCFVTMADVYVTCDFLLVCRDVLRTRKENIIGKQLALTFSSKNKYCIKLHNTFVL